MPPGSPPEANVTNANAFPDGPLEIWEMGMSRRYVKPVLVKSGFGNFYLAWDVALKVTMLVSLRGGHTYNLKYLGVNWLHNTYQGLRALPLRLCAVVREELYMPWSPISPRSWSGRSEQVWDVEIQSPRGLGEELEGTRLRAPRQARHGVSASAGAPAYSLK